MFSAVKKQLFKVKRRECAGLTFVSHHSVLDQVAKDIVQGLRQSAYRELGPATIFCGAHRQYGKNTKVGSRVFIQTEHLSDGSENELWGAQNAKHVTNILANLEAADAFLDLSSANTGFYANRSLPKALREKIVFGPKIFPSTVQPFQDRPDGRDIFFGDVSDRRRQVLRNHSNWRVHVLEKNTYGDALGSALAEARSVLNVHAVSAVYSEAPRLLSAVLAGKAVVSEPLETPFVANVHYLDIRDSQKISFAAAYEQLTEMTARDCAFDDFLKTHVF